MKILHILHFDFEFDRYYTDFSGYLEADCIQIQAKYFYACVGFAAERGDDIRVNLECAQICAYAKVHPELKVFMEELI